VSAGGLEEIGDELGSYWLTGAAFLFLLGIAVVGNDGGDAGSGGSLDGVDHDEKLHEVMVIGSAGGLNDKDVGATDVLFDEDAGFAVAVFIN
jgi:hypothetical protein